MKLEQQIQLVNRLLTDAQKELYRAQRANSQTTAVLIEEEINGLRHIGATLIAVRQIKDGISGLSDI